ncbi:MAG: arabinan endo-1,5-alpha-L-arabinosidase, partial [Tannerellaceae bacterium]|nr:arabinan endo-1,5-alpha-L-arabinosidase [Tannerellaceae bacterium]
MTLRGLFFSLLFLGICLACSRKAEEVAMSGNPVMEGWYADPEGIIYDDTYWVYP